MLKMAAMLPADWEIDYEDISNAYGRAKIQSCNACVSTSMALCFSAEQCGLQLLPMNRQQAIAFAQKNTGKGRYFFICLFNDAELNCVNTNILLISELIQLEIGISTKRYFPAIGTAGLERVWVNGANLEPCPPPRMIAKADLFIFFIFLVIGMFQYILLLLYPKSGQFAELFFECRRIFSPASHRSSSGQRLHPIIGIMCCSHD